MDGRQSSQIFLNTVQREISFLLASLISSWYHQSFAAIDLETIVSRSFLRVLPLLVLLVAVLPLMRTAPNKMSPDKRLGPWYSLCAQGGIIPGPGVNDYQAIQNLESFPGSEGFRRDLFSACQEVKDWFDTNNIPPPATSPDSSSDDSSPPSSFIMATTIVNSITSVAALGIAIAGYVHSIRKDRRDSKKEKGKKKDEGIDLLRRVDEDMLLRITQLEQTVNRAGTLRNLGRH